MLLLAAGSLKAQEQPGLPNDLDKQFVPDKNSVFNSDAKTKSAKNDNSLNVGVKNDIKFNIGMIPRSIAAFYYERTFTDQISLMGGLGVCYNKDRILGISAGIGDEFSSSSVNRLSVSTIFKYSTLEHPSLFGSFSFRVHWDSYYDWDWNPYFELNVRTYTNNLKIGQIDQGNGEIISGNSSTKVRYTAFNLIYGVQYYTDGKIHTTHDFYWGLGLRSLSYDTFVQSQNTTTSTVYPYNTINAYTYTRSSTRVKQFSPVFIMGYAFGIGWD